MDSVKDKLGVTSTASLLKGILLGLIVLLAAQKSKFFFFEFVVVDFLLTAGLVLCLFAAFSAQASAKRERSISARSETRSKCLEEALGRHFLLFLFDKEGRITEASDVTLERLGYSRSEIPNLTLSNICRSERVTVTIAEITSVVNSGKNWNGVLTYKAADETAVQVDVTIAPLKSTDGQTESFMSVGIEVSHERQAEIELNKSVALQNAFITHAPAAVAMFDNDMCYVAHTDRWLQEYSLPPESLIGQSHYDVFPEIPQHWKEKHQRILRGATERCDEERFLREDGTENIIRWEVRPWYLADNTIGGMMMLTEDISERKRLEDKLRRLARIDSLTGVPNRRSFQEELNSAIYGIDPNAEGFALAIIDVDSFKEINDTLGHDAGDELLKIVAKRLETTIGKDGIVARLGGDEFAFIIFDSTNDGRRSLDKIGEVQDTLSSPLEVDGSPRPLSVSIGVSMFPNDSMVSSDLMKNADLALYKAKNNGRARTVYFDPKMRTSLLRRVALQHGILDAISNDELLLYFQPIISSVQSSPPSFEALLRWNHPKQGLIAPGMFEEVFDVPKTASAIGELVVEKALQQISTWQMSGVEFGRVAINVTSSDFASGAYADYIERKLKEHNLSPSKLCIEVTEHVFLGHGTANVEKALQRLSEMGIEIALDDFGTGFASLSHLKAFPIDRIKVDRSFVRDIHTNADSFNIVKTIAQLGKSLDLAITAEGVELEEQLSLIKKLGPISVQGYLYSKPLPGSEVLGNLASKLENTNVA